MKDVTVDAYFILKIFTSTAVQKYGIYPDVHPDTQVSDTGQSYVTSYVGLMGRYIG